MEPMQDQNCSIQFEEVYNHQKSPQDLKFDQIIAALQEIMIDQDFEQALCGFMKHHWAVFDGNSSKQAQLKIFHLYRAQLQNYLQKNLTQTIEDFDWQAFNKLLQTRRNLIDEQILDTLSSFQDVDFRNSYEDEEILQTIKTNKVSYNKKVKGKDNIFATGEHPSANLFDKSLKAPIQKNKEKSIKPEEELLVPELILTVKSIRKN